LQIREYYNECIGKEATGETNEQLAYIADKASRQNVIQAHNIQRRIQIQGENRKEYLLELDHEHRDSVINSKKAELGIMDETLGAVTQTERDRKQRKNKLRNAILADYEAGTNFLLQNEVLGPDYRRQCLNMPKDVVSIKWHKCLHCQKSFPHFDQLRRHLAVAHQ